MITTIKLVNTFVCINTLSDALSSGEAEYSMMIMANNSALCIWNLLGEEMLNVLNLKFYTLKFFFSFSDVG